MGTLFELHSTKQVSIVWNRLLEEGNELRPATTVFSVNRHLSNGNGENSKMSTLSVFVALAW